MKKKSDEELGILITREMREMMFDEQISDSQKIKIFQAVVGDVEIKEPLLASYAKSLKSGYDFANKARMQTIYARRERQAAYQRDIRASTEMSVDERALLLKGKGKGKNIPLSPKGEKGVPSQIRPEDLMGSPGAPEAGQGEPSVEEEAGELAAKIAEWYPYEVKARNLKNVLIPIVEKFSARAVEEGWRAWADGGWSEPRFIPRRIVNWFRDGGWRQQPEKNPPARVTAGPSADETAAVLEGE